jgi:hypothetical protein
VKQKIFLLYFYIKALTLYLHGQFKVNVSFRNENSDVGKTQHGPIYNDPRNYQSAGDDTFLFEVGGNIGERCLPHNTNMLTLYKVNPNAEWIIKRRERFKIT